MANFQGKWVDDKSVKVENFDAFMDKIGKLIVYFSCIYWYNVAKKRQIIRYRATVTLRRPQKRILVLSLGKVPLLFFKNEGPWLFHSQAP